MTNNINKGDYVLIDNTNVEGVVNKVETRDSGTYVILKGGVTAFPIEDAYVISKHVEEESKKDFKVYNGELPRPIGVNDVFMPYSHEEETNEEHELADAELGHRMAIEPKEQYETDPGDEVEVNEPKSEDIEEDILKIIDDAIEGLNNLKEKYNA